MTDQLTYDRGIAQKRYFKECRHKLHLSAIINLLCWHSGYRRSWILINIWLGFQIFYLKPRTLTSNTNPENTIKFGK